MHTQASCSRQECCVLSFSHDPLSNDEVFMWEATSGKASRLHVPPEYNSNPGQLPCSQIHQMPSDVLKKMLHPGSVVSTFPVTLFLLSPLPIRPIKQQEPFVQAVLPVRILSHLHLCSCPSSMGKNRTLRELVLFSCLNSCLYLTVKIKGLTVAVILVIVLMEHPSIWQLCSSCSGPYTQCLVKKVSLKWLNIQFIIPTK